MTNKKTKLATLKFTRINEKKAKKELKKFMENTVSINLSPKFAYSIKFMERRLIFVLNKQFTRQLSSKIVDKLGILGIILEYNNIADIYFADKLVLSKPKSDKQIQFEITSLRGETMYDGFGNVKDETINFLIKGKPSEGRVRSTITGTISQKSIKFKKSTMPNKIYRKKKIPQSITIPNVINHV